MKSKNNNKNKQPSPNNTLLKIDWDGKKMPKTEFESILRTILKFHNAKTAFVTEYSTKRGWHIYITLHSTELNDQEIVLYQLLLGSDRRREFFNYCRIKNGIERWNVLFAWKANRKKEIVSREEFQQCYAVSV